MIEIESLKTKFSIIRPLLNERQMRFVAMAEAQSLGHGGIKAVAAEVPPAQKSPHDP
jgi:uncharacterized protein YlxP (DUF503 family)